MAAIGICSERGRRASGVILADGAARARSLQSTMLPGAGILLAGMGLVWLARRGKGSGL